LNHPIFGFNNYTQGRMITQPAGSTITAAFEGHHG
jgi:hypothetical protein